MLDNIHWLRPASKIILKLEMLAPLRAGQRVGHRRQADDDFGWWVKITVLFKPLVDQSSWNFGTM